MVLENIFRKLRRDEEPVEDEYIELDFAEKSGESGKMMIAVDKLEDYADSDRIQRKVREGYVVLVRIKELKEKDMGELKRAIARIRKTCLALNGDIAGVSDDWVIITPEYAKIHREQTPAEKKEE
ncbi:MAG: hypothetical protein B6U68_01705 [Candidatus Aenigmarchaeota archaeon ex4484_14]|nr:cell division protein SepF [Candidatus Aenigmarchaeota archaeon]OYT57549.1 MAG: hypothetical protein B6U68_01705 [Candidatus Aenigmarchaeota archaeon ex4484_14]